MFALPGSANLIVDPGTLSIAHTNQKAAQAFGIPLPGACSHCISERRLRSQNEIRTQKEIAENQRSPPAAADGRRVPAGTCDHSTLTPDGCRRYDPGNRIFARGVR